MRLGLLGFLLLLWVTLAHTLASNYEISVTREGSDLYKVDFQDI